VWRPVICGGILWGIMYVSSRFMMRDAEIDVMLCVASRHIWRLVIGGFTIKVASLLMALLKLEKCAVYMIGTVVFLLF
jgi:hypothetical protein